MKTSATWIVCSLSAALALGAGCDDSNGDASPDAEADSDRDGADGDADADTDAEGDADGDSDAAGDADGDGDSDGDADVERDLSRCGTGEELCGDCHGGMDVGGPPPDTSGETDPSLSTVGAHGAHFRGENFTSPVACAECHRVPTSIFALGHCDSPAPAEVRFGGRAIGGGMYPFWDRERGACSMVYCHGATLEGGRDWSPDWVGGDPRECGDCHSVDIIHGDTDCWLCHPSVVSPDLEIIAPELHINGHVEL